MSIETYEKTKKLLKKHGAWIHYYHNYVGLHETRVHLTLVSNKTQEKFPTKKELHEFVEASLEGFRKCLK